MAKLTRGPAPHAERGAVLITGIILMLVLTMLVLAMMRSGTLEERMARNARDQQRAMQSAEAALREGEAMLVSGAPFDPYESQSFGTDCPSGLCYKPDADHLWDKVDWTSATVTRTFAAAASQLAGVTEQPRYMIEILTPPTKSSSAAQCDAGLARITARGMGNAGSMVYVQSTVRFRVFSNSCL